MSTQQRPRSGRHDRPTDTSSGRSTATARHPPTPRTSRKQSRGAIPAAQTSRAPRVRLDPARPLLQLNNLSRLDQDGTYPTSSTRHQQQQAADDAGDVAYRSRAIARLHTAIESGDTDIVFQAYIQIPKDGVSIVGGQDGAPYVDRGGGGGAAAAALRSSLTAGEMRMVLRRLTSDTPRLQEGLLRLVAVVEEIRRRRRQALLFSHRAEAESRQAELVRYANEALEWDRLLDVATMNAMISYTGRCVRAAGPAEVDEALSILLDARVDIANSSTSTLNSSSAQSQQVASHSDRNGHGMDRQPRRQAALGPRLRSFLDRQKAHQQQPSPDRTTYNTLLDIVARSVHRFRATADRSEAAHHQGGGGGDDGDDGQGPLSPQGPGNDGDGSANRLAFNMQRLGIDAESGEYTTTTAIKIFDALLDRMRFVSCLSPDRITFNIILNMHCRLGRWDVVEETLRSMLDQELLDVADVNAVVWRYAISAEGKEGRMERLREVEAVYRAMRNNLLELEKRRKRAGAGGGAAFESPSGRAELDHGDDNLAPLQWSDRNETKGKQRRLEAPDRNAPSMGVLPRLLSLDRLPLHVVPDATTYALLIKLQTFSGDFRATLSTFRDMLSTPEVDVKRLPNGAAEIVDNGAADGTERYHRATPAIFNSFFRGYAKHGRPMQLVRFDDWDPLKSEWEPIEDVAEEGGGAEGRENGVSAWNVRTFVEIFEAFLRLKPAIPYGRAAAATTDRFMSHIVRKNEKGKGDGSRTTRRPKTDAADDDLSDVSRLPDGTPCDPTLVSSMRSTAASILSLRDSIMLPSILTQAPILSSLPSSTSVESTNEGQKWIKARRCPSTNELFFLLTAIRRVSGDHAAWSLAVWQMVEEKFGNGRTEQHDDDDEGGEEEMNYRTDGEHNEMRESNAEGWIGFRKNARLRWILKYLRGREQVEGRDGTA